MAQKHLYGELHAVVKALLGKSTREAMMAWLAGVIEHNMERAKMQMNPNVVRGAVCLEWRCLQWRACVGAEEAVGGGCRRRGRWLRCAHGWALLGQCGEWRAHAVSSSCCSSCSGP
jgi:hypothetical protein